MTEKACTTSSPFPPLTPGRLRLYSMRFCPYAQRARLVLNFKNIDYETVNINLRHKPSWFWDLNPNGTVPLLQLDGKVIYESLVICDHLDDVYPENKLTPADPYQKARDRLFVDLFSKVISCFYRFYGDTYGDEEVTNFFESLDKVETAFAERGTRFLGGDAIQMADLVIWPHTERFDAIAELVPETKVTAERFPNFCKWIENMGEMPVVKECRWDTPTHVYTIKAMKDGKPEYDYGL